MTAPRVGQIAALALAVMTLFCSSAFAAAGALDPSFDGDGRRVLPFAGIPEAALVQPDGKIVLAGFNADHEFAVWRLNPDGSLDRSFDGDGTVAIDFGSQDAIEAAALQPDGKLVVAGTTYTVQDRNGMAVARLNRDGSLDKTFDPGGPDGDGKKVIRSGIDSSATAVAVQPNGKILLAGGASGVGTFALTRLDSTGAIDGTVFEDPPGMRYEEAADIALEPDGTIVVAGAAIPDLEQRYFPTVARYTSQGLLDTTFAGTGVKTFADIEPTEVLVRPDRRIVVAGNAGDPDSRMAVTQLTAAGEIDKAFGNGGAATADFDGEELIGGAVLQGDGKLVVAGLATGENAFAVARLGAGGVLDPGFGSAGMTTVQFGEISQGSAVALQPDGRIVVGGVTATDDVPRLAVARLLGDSAGGHGPTRPAPAVARCEGRRATIVGTERRDILRGTRRADVIVALGGNDRVLGRGGNDVVCGGAGNDALSGGAGRDRLRGGSGRDRCVGAGGRDRARGCESRRSI
jgi:uncharacterized delta-60 repeat protein